MEYQISIIEDIINILLKVNIMACIVTITMGVIDYMLNILAKILYKK